MNRVGEKHLTREGYCITIIEYFLYENCTIQFEDGNIYYNIDYGQIKKGCVKNPLHPMILEVGFIGIGKHRPTINKKITKVYSLWSGIITRCYDQNYHTKFPTYEGVTVCKEWHNFQNFGHWFNNNYIDGFQLDKDILFKGNKIYSPETCCFVPKEINILFIKRDKCRGGCPIGVSIDKNGKFTVTVGMNNKRCYIGYFDTPQKAFKAYKVAKEAYIKEVADKWKDQITGRTYQAMYNYKVEITD